MPDKRTKEQLLRELETLTARVRELETGKTAAGADDKFHALFSNPAIPMAFIHASTLQFTEVNPAFANLYGYTVEEMTSGMGPADLTAEPENTEASLRRAAAGEHHVIPIRYHKKKDGTLFPIDITFGLVQKDGEDGVIYVIINDISVRIRDENRLRETNALFLSLVNSIPDIVYFKDPGLRHLMVNWAFEEFAGKTAKEVVGKTVEELFPPTLAEACRKSDEEVIRSGSTIRVEEVHGEPGAETFFETIKAPVVDSAGHITGVLGMSRDITARKLSAAKLMESERRFRDMLENVKLIAVMLDTDGKIAFANDFLCELTGWTRDEVITLDWFETFIPESGVRDIFMGAIADGTIPHYYVNEISTRAGDRRSVAWNNTILRGPDGRVIGTMSLGEDVTERLKAEENLIEAQRWLIVAQRAANIGIYIYDLDADTWTSSIVLDELFGIDIDHKRTADTWLELVHPADRREIASLLADAVTGERIFDREFRIVRKCDGRELWVHGAGQLVHDTSGTPIKLVGTVQDVTGRIAAERALRDSEQRFRALVDSSVDHIYMLSLDGVFLSSNNHNSTVQLKGVHNLSGKHISDLYDPDTAEMFMEKIAYVAASKKPAVFEHHVESPKGLRHHNATLYPIETGGRVTSIGGICRDITDTKRVEQESAKIQKIESIGVLAGGIAHDFNNFLAAILGGLDYATDTMTTEPAEAAIAIEQARKAVIDARGLTLQLLTFSKGGAPIIKTAAIATLLRDTATFTLRGSKASCEFDLHAPLWNVKIDPGQISQVVQNIVLNSTQAMPSGGALRISAENTITTLADNPHIPPGKYVSVTISDNGPGIPPESLPHIFDPYFSTKNKGQGLGLATAFSIINRHNGHITASCPPSGGAAFTFLLPATDESTHPQTAEPEPGAKPASLKVLVMDDQEPITKLLKRHFERIGFIPEIAPDGDTALTLYRAALDSGAPFDVVVLDLTIPGGMGGEETMRRLLEMDPHVKAIVASGYFSDPVMADHTKYGFKAIAEKPYFFNDLVNKIIAVAAG